MMFWYNICLAVQATVMPAFIVHFWWMQQDVPHRRLIFHSVKSQNCTDSVKKNKKKTDMRISSKSFH